jgi:hypothetical protein
MEKLDDIPSHISIALRNNGIDPSEVEIAAKADLSSDSRFIDVWVLLTMDTVYVLEGVPSYVSNSKISFKKNKYNTENIVKTWDQKSFKSYSLAGITEFCAETLTSSGILTAKKVDGTIVICRFSNTQARKFGLFAKLSAKVLQGKHITPEDYEGEEISVACPKCGTVYADPAIKICPK